MREIFVFSKTSTASLWSTQSPIQLTERAFSSEVSRLRREAGNSHLLIITRKCSAVSPIAHTPYGGNMDKLTFTLFELRNTSEWGRAVAKLVEALRYKPEGRGFDSRWCHWNFSLT
jgi:hypothetical protein